MYTDYLKHVQKLSMEQRGELFTAILCYASGENLPDLDLATDMIFGVIQERIDRDTALYMEKIQKRVEAGKLGGLAKASNAKQNVANASNAKNSVANLADNEYVNDNDNVNINTMCKSAEADALFERLWSIYPNKRGKGQVSEASKRRLLDIGFDEFQRAIDRYKADLDNETWKKPQNGSTFFNSGYVDYLDDNYVSVESTSQKKTGFNNFDQRQYNYDNLERKLLNSEPGRN